jgi:acetylglutamate kinase
MDGAAVTRPLVLKLGGELLETTADRARIAALASAVVGIRPLIVVHGGGRAIDAELGRRAIKPQKVEGLRVTDADTLDTVIAVLGGSANTALVASLVGAGVRAVGLTGVDAGFGRARRSAAHRTSTGALVDLGFVGDPVDADPGLVRLLAAHGYVPVIASLGLDAAPSADEDASSVLNVNADVMAARVAASLVDCDLAIAGGTAGVLDANGRSIALLDGHGIDEVIASGTATLGMIAKLEACRAALAAGVASVRIIDGRALDATHGVETAPGTRIATADAARV